jgi:hypothetical protein
MGWRGVVAPPRHRYVSFEQFMDDTEIWLLSHLPHMTDWGLFPLPFLFGVPIELLSEFESESSLTHQ